MMQSFKFVKTASSELQFKINQSIIFNYLRENGPIYRPGELKMYFNDMD
jgi:hypothetical protein